MAVVVAPEDKDAFIALAESENLEATVVATVTEEKKLVMDWKGQIIVDIDREFLNSNGAEKHINIETDKYSLHVRDISDDFCKEYNALASDLNTCSKRGLSERFDSTIGAGTVLMPFGGKHQQTPIQAMVHKISVEKAHTDDCSLMAYGYNPFVSEKSPYHGAYLAVVESAAKLIAAGASFEDTYLTFQEYFARPGKDPKRWGQPMAALLGAFRAQKELGIAAIGGKDSMSGSFEKLDVPPTLVSFAVTTDKVQNIVSPEFKAAGHKVYLLSPEYDGDGLPVTASLLSLFDKVTALQRAGKAVATYTLGMGGVAEAVLKMAIGNGIGFKYDAALAVAPLFAYSYGSFLIEATEEIDGLLIGETTENA
jgi:phosphoribosylformylglycinamidine synthase